jgi:serine/threonine protein kinase
MGMVLKNRYEVVEQIGRGGMAEIFRARIRGPHGFEKEVCIKRILPLLSSHPGFEAMFLDEARIAATLRHAGIVQVFDFDRDEEGNLFIVMEFVDGVNLKALMLRAAERREALSPAFAAALGRSVLQALHHAWTRVVDGRSLRLVHRDLSPHNILISREGEIKITDFGIAKAITSAVKTREGVIKGKLAYMSPEHAEGRSVDGRSDLYALGVVLWEVLAGERLFYAAGERKRPPTRSERRAVEPLHRLRPHVDEPLSRWVLRLLEPDPDRRPASALKALEELERLGLTPLSSLGISRMLSRLGRLEALEQGQGRGPVEGGSVAGDTLSPPHSDSTLKPYNAGSTVSVCRTPSTVPRRFPRPGLLLLLLGLVLAAAGGLLGLHFLARRGAAGPKPAQAPAGLEEPAVKAGETRGAAAQPVQPPGRTGAGTESREPGHEAPAGTGDQAGEERPPKAGQGWLSINVRPWAEVVIDGKTAGYTPLIRKPLPAGKHSVVIRNPELGKDKSFVVKIRDKKVKTLTFDFTQ